LHGAASAPDAGAAFARHPAFSPLPITEREFSTVALWDRLKDGLSKTRDAFRESLTPVLESLDRLDPLRPELEPEAVERLEEALLSADVGVDAMGDLVERVRRARPRDRAELESILIDAVASAVGEGKQTPWEPPAGIRPWVILLVGVNGSGKTTLCGKLAAREAQRGRRVVLVAADTFRAAAGEQLEIWSERSGAELVRQRSGADPAAVAYDGLEAARARNADVVLIDTAGRLHTRSNLMEELSKMRRILARGLPGAPHETPLVLDATLGQNGFAQAREFRSALEVTGVALTKLDGTSRGGVVIAVCRDLGLPVRLIGVGESAEDVEDFDPRAFAQALVRG
jgi:fused signal recognition particle receptor